MSTMDLLSNKFEAFLEEEMIDCEIPSYIKDNINKKFELRPYQVESQSLLRYYIEKYKKKVKPIHLMFNLATGSGKTLLMACNILYLYNRGYRNFIFFVNSTNIIDKTKYNFLDYTSSKFLFNSKITINNKNVDIREVNSLEDADEDSINIMFTTIQGLHSKLNTPTECSITYEDFKDKKVVLLSDEAHHLNTLTKSKLSKTEAEEKNSWEYTVNNILHHNQDNILLEYTATAELENPLVYSKYKDKVIYKYDLSKFRKDKYSKEVTVLQSDNKIKERTLQAVILSEYRRKVAEKYGIPLKPVILIKSNKKIENSKEMFKNFNYWIKNLSLDDLNKLYLKEENNIITKAFKFFEDENIDLSNLIIEIKYQFNEDKCIEVNSKEESEQKQIIVNTLEDRENWYRVVFAVDKLNEGWDVLNLFDIVRADDSRGSKSTTIQEAQLIGRGARYYPFALDEAEDKYKRKYDNDLDNELRILEELYYHSINEPKYISDLKKELKEKGIIEDDVNKITVDLKLKDSFKKSNVFKNGVIFANRQIVNTNKDIEGLSQMKVELSYEFDLKTGNIKETHILDDNTEKDKANNLTPTPFKLKDFGYNVIRKAISKNEFYSFENLKKYLPNIQSIDEFIMGNKYLGAIEVTIRSKYTKIDDIDNTELLDIVLDILKEIEGKIKKNYIPYIGTKEFYPEALKNLNFEKKASFIIGGEDKEMGKPMSLQDGSNLRLNLMNEKWYAYEENYGTSEEKNLILLMKSVYSDLINSGYEDVYLIRNEKILKLYHFDTDQVTEPDFLLWAKKKEDSDYKYYQLFIEPKGNHLLEKDKWKEELLLRIEDESSAVLSKPNEVIKESTAVYEVEETLLPKDASFDVKNSVLVDNERYRLIGLSFYNKSQEKEFKKEFKQKLEI
ncbi:DEAD/DEAH box helicase family protein [Clostridium perfringens]